MTIILGNMNKLQKLDISFYDTLKTETRFQRRFLQSHKRKFLDKIRPASPRMYSFPYVHKLNTPLRPIFPWLVLLNRN